MAPEREIKLNQKDLMLVPGKNSFLGGLPAMGPKMIAPKVPKSLCRP